MLFYDRLRKTASGFSFRSVLEDIQPFLHTKSHPDSFRQTEGGPGSNYKTSRLAAVLSLHYSLKKVNLQDTVSIFCFMIVFKKTASGFSFRSV